LSHKLVDPCASLIGRKVTHALRQGETLRIVECAFVSEKLYVKAEPIDGAKGALWDWIINFWGEEA
jgi:hypothetical protein